MRCVRALRFNALCLPPMPLPGTVLVGAAVPVFAAGSFEKQSAFPDAFSEPASEEPSE